MADQKLPIRLPITSGVTVDGKKIPDYITIGIADAPTVNVPEAGTAGFLPQPTEDKNG